jgi:predicted dithiol-disulfide oxidoreductase (DUF899 family)
MTEHTIGTRDEWRAARLELLEAEKELTRRSDEVARMRQALPWVPVGRDYVFEGEDGPVTLAGLFGGRSQLIVHHFMFPPSWAAGCPSCSSVADGYDGFRVHLEHHDVALVAVSRAPLAKLLAYRRRMGWGFPWVSSGASSFNVDFGVSFTERQVAEGAEYNYREFRMDADGLAHHGTTDDHLDDVESPGISTFVRDGDRVLHAYSSYARGTDGLWGMYQWLDRAPSGRRDTGGQWFERHDEYGER